RAGRRQAARQPRHRAHRVGDMQGNPTPGQVLLEREGELAWVTLSNPGRLNAISVAMWEQLRQVFASLAGDASVRCVVVRGAGGNFAAGADIREFPQVRG